MFQGGDDIRRQHEEVFTVGGLYRALVHVQDHYLVCRHPMDLLCVWGGGGGGGGVGWGGVRV